MISLKSLLVPTGWKKLGCYADPNNSKVLKDTYTRGLTNLTLESCLRSCAAAGYKYAGIEWSEECACGNTVTSGSTLLSDSQCSMPCAGLTFGATGVGFCGGPTRMSVYQLTGTTPATTTSVASSTVVKQSTSARASTASTSASTPTTASYVSLGCILDDSTRVMNGSRTIVKSVNECAQIGKASARKYFGLENGNECYVSDLLSKNIPSTGCNIPCSSGGATGGCGGNWRLNLYQFS
jgi:hypothetical protein